MFNVVKFDAHAGKSAKITADVTSGNAVKVSGNKTVAPAVAGDVPIGVSHHTRSTTDLDPQISFRLRGDIIPMKASVAVTAGDHLYPAAAGEVKLIDGASPEDDKAMIGVAWTDAAAGETVEVIVL